MINNLQDELYLLESKQAQSAKICAKKYFAKCSTTCCKVLERQNMQNQTISELYIDDNKTKYSSNPKDILESAENFYEKLEHQRPRFPNLL